MRTFHTVFFEECHRYLVIQWNCLPKFWEASFYSQNFWLRNNPDVQCKTTFLDDKDKLDKYSKPCTLLTFTISWSISPLQLSKYFFRSWSQYSKTRVSFFSLCRTSWSLFGMKKQLRTRHIYNAGKMLYITIEPTVVELYYIWKTIKLCQTMWRLNTNTCIRNTLEVYLI